MARITLSTRNTKGVIANILSADKRAQRAVRRVVREAGLQEYEIAYALCPVDTGFMQDSLRLEFQPEGLGYELGWREEDFTGAGLPFYPVYVEFGTSKMAAQPSLFPARDAVRPVFERSLSRELRAAYRRRGT